MQKECIVEINRGKGKSCMVCLRGRPVWSGVKTICDLAPVNQIGGGGGKPAPTGHWVRPCIAERLYIHEYREREKEIMH